MNMATNEVTARNQSDRGTWVATPPAMARSTKPDATEASSTTARSFTQTLYAVLIARYRAINTVNRHPATNHDATRPPTTSTDPAAKAWDTGTCPAATGRCRFSGWRRSASASITSFKRYIPDATAEKTPNAPNA